MEKQEKQMETRTIQEAPGGQPYVYLKREWLESMLELTKGDKVVVIYRPDKIEIVSDQVAFDALEAWQKAPEAKESPVGGTDGTTAPATTPDGGKQ